MALTFGAVAHDRPYAEFFDELSARLAARFGTVESGIQGDAWIWIFREGLKVEVSTFYSERFEISAEQDHALLRDAIAFLQAAYGVRLYDPPIER